MGKSILVMDAPEKCSDCKLCKVLDRWECACCILCNDLRNENLCRTIDTVYYQDKPDWCPLQNAPEKKDKNPYHNECESGYVDGWNDCLDQILNGG